MNVNMTVCCMQGVSKMKRVQAGDAEGAAGTQVEME